MWEISTYQWHSEAQTQTHVSQTRDHLHDAYYLDTL